MGKGQHVRLKEVEGYASSHYHIPSNAVQRAELTGVGSAVCTCAAFNRFEVCTCLRVLVMPHYISYILVFQEQFHSNCYMHIATEQFLPIP